MIEIGDKLSNRYQLNSLIGTGGMANVYLGRDLILDRDVAVKVLRFDFQDNKEAIKRFQREAMSASQLLHHNIVEVYDVDEEDDQQYIVMEYVDGTDLKHFIQEHAPISLELAVSIMSQILAGIEIAHRHRIIHRDIKPQNILITGKNQVKITDFGIAIALTDTSITQTNTLLGSVHYLSPEQARGGNATTKSDIYALGVVLYELITGSVPYDGESAVSVALKHFQEPFPRIREQLDYVPQSLENVVLKATAKDPADRYESVQAMLSDLSTSLSVNRMNEPIFQPQEDMDKTLVLQPIQTESGHQSSSDQDLEDFDFQAYDQVAPLEPPRKRRRWLSWLILFVVALSLLVGGFLIFNNFFAMTTVPNLTGLSQEEASQKLSKSNLQVGDVSENWHETIQNGQVIETEPEAGKRIKKNQAVNLIVSKGKTQVKLDDYVGQNYEATRRLLTDADFIVERRGIATTDPSQVGVVLAQSVEPGSVVVPSETPITLTVGSSSDSIVMQDFYNLSVDMVYHFAEEYGVYVEEVYEYSEFVPKGQVISQKPAPGTPLEAGQSIEVTVSQGPEASENVSTQVEEYVEYVPTYESSDLDQEKPLPNKIQVFIGDANNKITELAREFEITESQPIQLSLYIPSNSVGQYRITRDGDVIAESNQVYPQ
ncbi:Stk1 family PASTA domain-containing Ser/Thr kinase [Hutsoniella sourekii]|uniref:Stk1 family PASTA domain-containing Ser/Thr kinase n=1 Tax=Hutsoniella sourekii TaxID=87650 RepID=UPI00048864D3|nr:Stk1 family PASTA domain-containing Ser/Thr kinase [Hutsoniella sourekii]